MIKLNVIFFNKNYCLFVLLHIVVNQEKGVVMAGTGITKQALDFWMEKYPITQTALAKKAGLSQNYISLLVKGERDGSLEAIQSLARCFGASVSDFLGVKDRAGLPEIEFVERVKAVPRAGNGGLVVDGDCVGLYSFHSSFLRRKGGSAESMKIFKVDGDSMEPTLHSGDLIMVNRAMIDVQSGHIYLLRMEGELMVKRLERRPGGIILVRSDNKEYDSIEINLENENVDFEIFGKMVWLCREF